MTITELHPRTTPPHADRDQAIAAAADLLVALGQNLDEPDLIDTPRRLVDGLLELITPRPFALTTFANDDEYDELVVVHDIPFVSLCRHHVLPFRGTATVGYLPGERLAGLSKLARVVEQHARSLQVQEQLTVQIAQTLEEQLAPRGVGVVVRAEHLCMSIRGVQAAGASTLTTAFRGALIDDAELRARFRIDS